VLTQLGYGSSLPFEGGQINLTSNGRQQSHRVRAWKPAFDRARLSVRVGDEPVDLGGIGKGLAVRWASQLLVESGDSVLVEAGGDVMALGGGPNGDGWMISVEDPFGGADPVAVLRLVDRAAATSSVRIRSWIVDGEQVHHLVDPRTRRPAQSYLRSVTVVHQDPALAEVWSKSLFIAGRSQIRKLSDDSGLASLWVDVDGRVTTSRAMRNYVAWQVANVG
jgi:thiamine biosynthesis lipoprotein